MKKKKKTEKKKIVLEANDLLMPYIAVYAEKEKTMERQKGKRMVKWWWIKKKSFKEWGTAKES